jgi:predicted chitinase
MLGGVETVANAAGPVLGGGAAELEPWADAIRRACVKFEINNIRRIAAFIAQMAHESDLSRARRT